MICILDHLFFVVERKKRRTILKNCTPLFPYENLYATLRPFSSAYDTSPGSKTTSGACSVGVCLFSRAASSQVSSTQVGLTAVFGMGTGVPPPPSTPTMRGALQPPGLAPPVGLEPTTLRLTADRYKPSIACYLSIISNSIRIYGRATLYGLPYRP